MPAEADGLPGPTGPYSVGRTSFHWIDGDRPELETREPGDVRELMVHVFHPAEPDPAASAAIYVPDAGDMAGVWRADQRERIGAMATHSREGAALPAGTTRFPAAVFMPGGGMKVLTYHALLEDLASHGWVVAAVEPPYNAPAVRFPDGRVLGRLPPDERGWPEPQDADEELRFYIERIAHWSADLSFVIDQLAELDGGDGPFAGRLDLEDGVGAFGHSRGGQAAGAVRLLDERVRGGINLDGTVGEHPVQPILGEDVSGDQPFLWVQTPIPPPPTDEELERDGHTREDYDAFVAGIIDGWHRRLATIEDGAMRATFDFPGITHIDFSDEPFWDGSMTSASRPGKVHTIVATRAWVLAFLEGSVRGDWSRLDDLTADPESGITIHAFGPLVSAPGSDRDP